MRKLNLLIVAVLLSCSAATFAQITVPVNSGVPQAFPYSSQVFGNDGQVLASRFIKLRISMRSGTPDGTASYIETDTVTTSPNGIFSVVVGGGTIVQGRFDSIPWSTGKVYQQVELDPNGGNNFTDMGATQLLSLPYAIAAGNGVSDVKYDSTGKLNVTSADGTTAIRSTAASWMTTGNAGAGSSGFLGTTDNTDFVLKRMNAEGLRLRSGDVVTMPGRLGLGGVAAPATTLDINGGVTLRDTTINVSGSFNLNVGNRSLIFINSSVYPGSASVILSNGSVKGQIVILSITGVSNYYGVRFYNNGTIFNTRINSTGGGVNAYSGQNYLDYTDGNTLTVLWNGTDWVQVASSITK